MNGIAAVDRYLDYIPVVSSATNLITLYLKYLIIPNLDEKEISESEFYTHIKEKRTDRCLLLTIAPCVSNITFAAIDSLNDLNFRVVERLIQKIGNHEHLNISSMRLPKLPEGIWNLTHLTELNLADNSLLSLPKEIGLLTNLTDLYLDNNELTSLPQEISQLTNLFALDISRNNFTSLHVELLKLTHLTVLSLRGLNLKTLPKEILELTRLAHLNLGRNKLDHIPQELWKLTGLIELNLMGNWIDNLPLEMEQLTLLESLNLSGNLLTALPDVICQMSSLTELNLGSNQLLNLPDEIGLLTNLIELKLKNNNLGSLPPQIGSLINLTRLIVTDNWGLDELPLSLGQIPGLTEIDKTGTQIEQCDIELILNQCRLMRSAQTETILAARLQKWKGIGRSDHSLDIAGLSVTQKIDLNEWLVRLEKTGEFTRIQSGLAKTMCNILEDALKNKEFQELFFSQIAVNNACCQDRASMAFNELYTSWLIMCRKDLPLSILTGVAKTLCLRKEIAKRLGANERESVEIYLYYETKLRNELQLITAFSNMAYADLGKRQWIDEKSLIADVNRNFFEELFDLPIFQKMIENKWDAEFYQKLEDLGPCPNGGPENEAVLNHQYSQGKIMTEWRQTKMAKAKEWYETNE